jgi:hypothetical protein
VVAVGVAVRLKAYNSTTKIPKRKVLGYGVKLYQKKNFKKNSRNASFCAGVAIVTRHLRT